MARDRIAFLADGHLVSGDRPRIDTLIKTLDELAERCDVVCILGDLFEIWLGVDVCEPAVADVGAALRSLRARGVRTIYVEGNRDFAIGRGATAGLFDVIAERDWVEPFGERRFHLSHGDLVNQNDRQYRAWRAFAKGLLAPVLLRVLTARSCQRLAVRLEERLRRTNRKYKSYFPQELCLAHAQRQVAGGSDVVLVGHFHHHFVQPVAAGSRSGLFVALPFWHDTPQPVEFDRSGRML